MNFVTGGTGLLGTQILHDLLLRDEEVLALKRKDSDLETVQKVFDFLSPTRPDLFQKINWVDGDVCDIYSLEDPVSSCSRVYHSAAVVSFHKKDAEALKKVNVGGTRNLVNVCLGHKIEKFCHVSSTAALGRTKSGTRINELSEWKDSNLNTRYAVSKYNSEMEVWRGAEEGLNIVIVNPSVVIGPGDPKRSSAELFAKINSGLSFYPAGSNAFVSSVDVSRACIELMNSEIHHERFLVGGENMDYKKLFELISDSLGRKRPSIEAKKWMLRLGRYIESLKENLGGPKASITKETVMTTGNRFHYDSAKIKESLDFEFSPIELAIERTGAFIKS